MNGSSNSGSNIYILYKVINSDSDAGDALFNAFPMPRSGKGPTLATVKQHCSALYGLNHLGPEGYHWRVCVEDKSAPGEVGVDKTFSWWDIQDENAVLPAKQATQYQLSKFFAPPHRGDSVSDAAASVAKGAFKSLGKAMSHAVAGHDGAEGDGTIVSVVAFKLLDLVKMHDEFEKKNHGHSGHIPQPVAPRAPAPKPQRSRAPPPPPQRTPATAPAARRATSEQSAPPRRQQQRTAEEPSLMDFGSSAPPSRGRGGLQHARSSPASFSNESRAERLKREYSIKQQNNRRVWDDVDQRWVEMDPKVANSARASSAAVSASQKKVVGISIDPTNAVGKSADVQAAVNARVNDMRQSQAKALQEVREREETRKKEEADEDQVRKRLTPKIKAWSEEHGKKKQLRALLATLHTILWPGANWKQVSIGDLLDDSKVKRCFHKASRVVHPDKTHHLDAEKRFLAKRIFDALSQAKTEFDGGAK